MTPYTQDTKKRKRVYITRTIEALARDKAAGRIARWWILVSGTIALPLQNACEPSVRCTLCQFNGKKARCRHAKMHGKRILCPISLSPILRKHCVVLNGCAFSDNDLLRALTDDCLYLHPLTRKEVTLNDLKVVAFFVGSRIMNAQQRQWLYRGLCRAYKHRAEQRELFCQHQEQLASLQEQVRVLHNQALDACTTVLLCVPEAVWYTGDITEDLAAMACLPVRLQPRVIRDMFTAFRQYKYGGNELRAFCTPEWRLAKLNMVQLLQSSVRDSGDPHYCQLARILSRVVWNALIRV